jgi:hypothetical protein
MNSGGRGIVFVKLARARSPRRPVPERNPPSRDNINTAMAPSKAGNKGNNGAMPPPPPIEKDDRQTRPMSRDMPGSYTPGQAPQQQQQVQMIGRHPEDRDPGRETRRRIFSSDADGW